MWFRVALALGAVGLVVGSLAGCGASDSDCQGDPGKVTEKDYDATSKTNTTADYELTILRADGKSTYEKDVSSTAYDDWYKVGSKFPSSKHCEDGKAK